MDDTRTTWQIGFKADCRCDRLPGPDRTDQLDQAVRLAAGTLRSQRRWSRSHCRYGERHPARTKMVLITGKDRFAGEGPPRGLPAFGMRSNATHVPLNDPQAWQPAKSRGQEVQLPHQVHIPIDNRNDLIVDPDRTLARGTGPSTVALVMPTPFPTNDRARLGLDQGYGATGLIEDYRGLTTTPRAHRTPRTRAPRSTHAPRITPVVREGRACSTGAPQCSATTTLSFRSTSRIQALWRK
jgi:hypothetical protein